MKIAIAGSGKLAIELTRKLPNLLDAIVIPWNDLQKVNKQQAIVIHAGSGRQLAECIDYCDQINSVAMSLK